MIVAPAAGIGMLIVGLGGAIVAFLILDLVEKWRNGHLSKSRDSYRPVYQKELLSEGWQIALAVAGAIIAVATVIGLMIIVPMWSDLIWTGLTILGYVGGFLSLVIFGFRSIFKTSPKRGATGSRARRGIRKPRRKKTDCSGG